jgi:hypothetical protein
MASSKYGPGLDVSPLTNPKWTAAYAFSPKRSKIAPRKLSTSSAIHKYHDIFLNIKIKFFGKMVDALGYFRWKSIDIFGVSSTRFNRKIAFH